MEGHSTESTHTFIRYNPERTDLTVSEPELQGIRTASYNHWKDFFLVAVSVGVSCAINAVTLTPKPFALTGPLFLNYLAAGLGLALAFVFCILWLRSRKDLDKLITAIETKPRYRVEVTSSGMGAVPPIILRRENGVG